MSEPTKIKDFPGQAVEAHLRETGALPNELQYTAMTPNQMIETCGDNPANAWRIQWLMTQNATI